MIRHVAGIADIVEDLDAAVRFYRDVLGLPVKYGQGESYAEIEIGGILHFGIWSREGAAEATLGDSAAVDRVPLGFTVGFEVDAVEPSSQTMVERGWQMVQPAKKEPWGQIISRFLSPSGALCEVSETPRARQIVQPMQVQPPDKAE